MATKRKRTPPTKAVLSQKGAGQSRYVAKRQISINNRTVANQIRHIEYFALNYSSTVSGFIRASQSDSITLFDGYVENLLGTAHTLVKDQLAQLTPVYQGFLDQGYVFDAQQSPAKVEVQIIRNCVNDFLELLLDLDELVTLLNHLEKTPFLKTPAMFTLVQEWSDIPRKVNSRLQGMSKKLNDKFNFNPNAKDIKSLNLDFTKINEVLEEFQRDKAHLFAKSPPKSVQQANDSTLLKDITAPPAKSETPEHIQPTANAKLNGKTDDNWLTT